MYVSVLKYGCGSIISHTCGVLVSGGTHTCVNCSLERIRLLFMCMLIFQTMVEGTLILRQTSTNGCLVWLFKFIHMKVVDFVVEFEKQDIQVHVGCAVVCDGHKLQQVINYHLAINATQWDVQDKK